MKLKDKVLCILEENRGAHISGAEIAKRLEVSRNAVWKAVEELRSGGTGIEAVRNGGYCIPADESSLSVQGIEAILGQSGYIINVEQSVTSTNTVLKSLHSRAVRKAMFLSHGSRPRERAGSAEAFIRLPTADYIFLLYCGRT